MTPRSSLILVGVSSLAFCVLGGLLGAFIATVFPEYYESVLHGTAPSGFPPVPVAIGLGTTQGAASGAIIGLAIVGLFLWKDARQIDTVEVAELQGWPIRIEKVLRAVAILVVFSTCVYAAYLAGIMLGHFQQFKRQTAIRSDRVAEILELGSYSQLEPQSTKRNVHSLGELPSAKALAELNDALTEEFGRPEANRMTNTIRVIESPKP